MCGFAAMVTGEPPLTIARSPAAVLHIVHIYPLLFYIVQSYAHFCSSILQSCARSGHFCSSVLRLCCAVHKVRNVHLVHISVFCFSFALHWALMSHSSICKLCKIVSRMNNYCVLTVM